MDQEPDVIRQDIEQTRESLTEKLEVLENEVKGTITGARETVEEITSNVKETVQDTVQTVKRTFDLPYQVNQHPWGMMGGSMVAGFLAGYLLPATRQLDGWGHRISRPATATAGAAPPAAPGYLDGHVPKPAATKEGPSFLDRLLDRFEPEVNRVKEMAIGTMVGLLRDWVKQALPPSLAPKVEELMNQTTSKLGGEPIRGPVLGETNAVDSATL